MGGGRGFGGAIVREKKVEKSENIRYNYWLKEDGQD
jgi:hypothetical protein